MSPKVLVLSYDDSLLEGHGYSIWNHLKDEGYEAYFISYASRYSNETPDFFIDAKKPFSWNYFVFRLKRRLKFDYKVKEDKSEYCLFNARYYYHGNAKKILKKISVIPDIIIITWCDFFISPKVIYDLYHLTNAKIVISMVDPHILGGGCHFPCDCKQYETGCSKCPVLENPEPAKRLFDEKVRYLSDIPMLVAGSPYDVLRGQKTIFLKNAIFQKIVVVPNIPFLKTKKDARKRFDIPEDNFVLFWGALFTTDKRKGFSFFIRALEKFRKKIGGRKVSVIVLVKDEIDTNSYDLGDNVTMIQPGFLDQEGLFSAFYASNVFVSTSIDDSGPMMVNYSIACGTPVISFPVGVAVDLVKHGETGYMAKFMDADDLSKGFELFYRMNQSHYEKYAENCISLMGELKKTNKPWYLNFLQ